MCLVDDPSGDHLRVPVRTDLDALDEIGEPTSVPSSNDETVGLDTTHSCIVSAVGPSSLARPGYHPGESESSPRLGRALDRLLTRGCVELAVDGACVRLDGVQGDEEARSRSRGASR